jgi:chromosome segregation ATPase
MMGSSPPSQSTLSDLTVLLELLQAASDPKTAKKVIADISAARKQYDDAIAESNARQVAAQNAEAHAATAQAKAEAAELKLDKKAAALAARQAEIQEMEASVAGQMDAAKAKGLELDVQISEIKRLTAQADTSAANQLRTIAQDKTNLERQIEAFDAKVQEVADLKADYESKLAKFKALAA